MAAAAQLIEGVAVLLEIAGHVDLDERVGEDNEHHDGNGVDDSQDKKDVAENHDSEIDEEDALVDDGVGCLRTKHLLDRLAEHAWKGMRGHDLGFENLPDRFVEHAHVKDWGSRD